MKKIEKKKRFKPYHYVLLSLPLIMVIMWIISIKTSQKVIIQEAGLRLSPINNTAPLLRSLFIFIGAYLAFLAVIFHENLREIFLKRKKTSRPY